MTDDPNRRIGDYEVLAVLGAGGMGKVFKVRNVISDRIEAMKILLPDLAGRQELADRFLREIKLLASLDHPNIAQLRTALTLSNRLVMVMEYVEGTTIADRLEQGPIPPEEAMGYVTQVLNALAYAHGRNVIHRDIKPANMMITPNGSVKLMDFGIARASSDQSMTVTGTTVGSLFYMSPEQVKGEGVDFRSDLYSLGVSLYEMVTGERPFKASSDYSLMTAQLQERPKPPSELRPGLPGQLNGIILHSMAKDPAERFQSADEFRQALEALRQTMPASSPVMAPVVAPPAAAAFKPVIPVQPPVQPLPVAAPTVAATAAFTPVPTAVGTAPNPPALPMPPTQPTPSVMQLSPPPSKGRGLYMALGAVIVLAVLVLAGISLPRMLRTRASEQKAADQNTSSTSSATAAQTPNSTTTPSTDASAAANPSTGASGTASSDTGTSAQPPADSGTAASTSGTTTSSGEGSSAGTATTDASAGAGAPPTSKSKSKKGKSTSTTTTTAAGDPGSSMQGSSTPGSPNQTTSGTDQGQVTADTAPKESVEEMEQDVDQTSSRAAAANSSLDTMTRQLRSQGLNLRGDIVAAQEAMKTNLDKANQALQRNDTKNARRYLNMAQANMEKIEKFLGH